jgi:PAS domain S-box-containing protein
MLHRHLERQLRKLGLDCTSPPSAEVWAQLLEAVSRTYDDADRERYTMERAVTLSSREMQDLNARLAWERDQLARIFRAAPVGMIQVDLDGFIHDLNPAFEQIVDRPRGALLGLPVWEMAHPDDRENGRKLFQDATSGAGRIRLVKPSGECAHTNLGLAQVRDEDGNLQFTIAVVEDVTEKERLEIELRQAQKLESVGRLASGIAHEINTPVQFVGDNVGFLGSALTDVLGLCEVYRAACQLALAGAGGLTAEDAARLQSAEETADLEYIREHAPSALTATLDGVGRVAHIVRSMKAFAHPDRGQRRPSDLNAALRTTLTVATNELKYVAAVETDFGSIPPVPCLLGELNQVFLNLLVNAAHAIRDVVGDSGERGTIRVRSYREGDQAVVAISDTGTGIPAAIRSKIFDPFFTTKEVGRGTGQGLALARSVVVDQHGGTLTFDTELGRGTTFFVRLPLGQNDEDEQDAQARSQAA